MPGGQRFLLIIGYGNSLRYDDGAGLELALRLATYWRSAGANVRHLPTQQLTPELAYDISAEDVSHVLFVDARLVQQDGAGAPTAEVQVEQLVPQPASPGFAHHLSPEALLVYAEHLYGRRPEAWLVSAPAFSMDHGEGLSETARRCIEPTERVAAFIQAKTGLNLIGGVSAHLARRSPEEEPGPWWKKA